MTDAPRPNRRNHITQKVRIAGQRTLYISLHDDEQPAEIFLRLKGRRAAPGWIAGSLSGKSKAFSGQGGISDDPELNCLLAGMRDQTIEATSCGLVEGAKSQHSPGKKQRHLGQRKMQDQEGKTCRATTVTS